MFVALVIHHVLRIRSTILLSLAYLAITIFFGLFHQTFPHPQTGVNFRTWKRKYTNEVKTRHILIFGMLESSQIVTSFSPRWSHNVAHNCDRATLNANWWCSSNYYLSVCPIRHLLNFRPNITPLRKPAKIFYDC